MAVKLLHKLSLLYSAVVSVTLVTMGLFSMGKLDNRVVLMMIPVAVYFLVRFAHEVVGITRKHQSKLGAVLVASLGFYAHLILGLLVVASVLVSSNSIDLLYALIYLPFFIPLLIQIVIVYKQFKQSLRSMLRGDNKQQAALSGYSSALAFSNPMISDYPEPEMQLVPSNYLPIDLSSHAVEDTDELAEDEPDNKFEAMTVEDKRRRQFLKIIGGSGASLLMMLLFLPGRADAAFFGSTPGPGIVGVKDSTGVKIDPAIKKPTDGYSITQLDDTNLPSYYGFVNKDGAWYISRETAAGEYRYIRGGSGFASNWTNRASLSYDYFDVVF